MSNPSERPFADDIFVESAPAAAKLALSMAVSDCDHIRDLINGVVRAEGIVLTPSVLPVEEIFFRTIKYQEWDISELSSAKYFALASSGRSPVIALPVFPSRVFRHSAIYVGKDRHISAPKDLEGKSVGIPEWAQTAGVYVRGMLEEHYGVDLSRIRWVQAGVNQAGRQEKVKLAIDRFDYTSRPDTSLDAMLISGEIDAAISARPPNVFNEGRHIVDRLFPDFRIDERKYYDATRIFPIMHVLVVRRSTYERHRWIATSLLKAFDEAKNRSVKRLTDITAAGIPFAWAAAIASDLCVDFGGDPWPYGTDANRETLMAFSRYTHNQGITDRLLSVDDLFPRETAQTVRV